MPFRAESAEQQLQIPNSVFLKNFWEGVVTGRFPKADPAEVKKLVSDQFFSHDPLTKLTGEEEGTLFGKLYSRFFRTIDNPASQVLCDNPVIFIPKGTDNHVLDRVFNRTFKPFTYFITQGLATKAAELGYPPLSVKQKIELYRNPNVWEEAEMLWGEQGASCAGSVCGRGSRNFFRNNNPDSKGLKIDDSYGITIDEFKDVAKNVHSRVGRDNLRFCDIGGGTGLACHDIKAFFPNFEFTNITLDEQPAMWSGINHLFIPAERMPKSLYESFDLIFSNMAWRYFVYPDIALKNVVQSLSVGGYADIHYSHERSPLIEEALGRLHHGLDKLSQLKRNGQLDFTLESVNSNSPVGRLTIQKHKSIEL